MGGRGTFAKGNNIGYNYQTVGTIAGVKVLQGINGKHGLPDESHSGNAYIKLKPNGIFHEMRIYDNEHYLVKEIAYHPEPKLNNGNKSENVLHIHEYKRDNFINRTPRLMTSDEIKQYKIYLTGVEIK